MRKLLPTLALAICSAAFAETTPDYTAADAAKHVGETATVTDKVERVNQAKGGNIFIDMGGKHPNAPFTAFIASPNAAQFPDAKQYEGATITVSGKIEMHKDKAEIKVSSPSQITVKEAATSSPSSSGSKTSPSESAKSSPSESPKSSPKASPKSSP